MISVEDESSSVINGRLRPRKSTATSPSNKPFHKPEHKIAQDKPKKNSTPSKASPNKEDDLTAKADVSALAQFLCPYCDRSFSSKQSINKHARRIHLPTSKQDDFFKCLFCHHSEALSSDIMRHMVDSHPNQYFACLDCSTRFPSTSQLATHKFNLCEKQKQAYRSKLRQKSSSVLKNDQKSLLTDDKPISVSKEPEFNGVVISCELKPSQVHDELDIEDKITTNFILPSNIANTALDRNALIILDDIQFKRRIPPNVSFGNADADQILSRLGVVHRSPLVGESARRDCLAAVDHCTQLFEKCFDTKFYSRVASNVQENLARFLDGSYKFSPDPDKVIKTRKSKSSAIINTAEGFPILLPQEQYSRNRFDGYIPRAIAPKHKWKWDSTENDKSIIIDPSLIKRDNHVDNCIVTLISSLDIWTQLRMRRKYEGLFCNAPAEKIEKQKIIGRELKEILESREIPCTSSSSSVECAASAMLNDRNDASESDLPSVLGLSARAGEVAVGPAAVLSGEWVRPRCYVCCACGDQTRDARALTAHMAARHPNAQVQHYEIVGQALLNADILRHLYVPPSQMPNRTRPQRGYRDCTKCHKSVTLEELHQHMLDCAGDTPAVRRKGRSRPFGVRRRRTRLPDTKENTIRKKIRKDMRTRHNPKDLLRTRPRIRTEVGDAESIRKMISGLPAKRHRQAAGQQQVLRPRRKLDKQRSKQKIKRLKKNPKTIQTKSDTNDPSVIDEDDQPLKPKSTSTSKIDVEKAAPVKKRFSNRVVASKKNKVSLADIKVATLLETQKDTPDDSSGSSQPQQISSTDSSQTVNFYSRNNDSRAGRESRDSNNDNNNRDEGEKPHGDDNGSSSALLKHSINKITASSSTKSLQSVDDNLPEQAAAKGTLHDTRQSFLENEVSSSTPDKPPLPTNQKRSKEKKRASLLNCIEKIKSQQKGESITDHTGTMSIYHSRFDLAHTLMDPHPAVISCSRDESGVARNIVPEALVFGGSPTYEVGAENLGINEPLMLAPIVNPYYPPPKLSEYEFLPMWSKTIHEQMPEPNNEYDPIRYLMLQNQNNNIRHQLDTLASARLPIVPSQIARSQDRTALNQERLILQSQDLYKYEPPAHFSNSVFPVMTMCPSDVHYENRPENVLRLNDETINNLQQNPNLSPLSQQSWRREMINMHQKNSNLQIPTMLPSMASNGLVITPTHHSETETYGRIIDDTGVHYTLRHLTPDITPENSEDLRQLGHYSSHSNTTVLNKPPIKEGTKARRAMRAVTYDTHQLAYVNINPESVQISKPTEHYHSVERHAPSDIQVYDSAMYVDEHRLIPCSRSTIDSSHIDNQDYMPKSLYSRKKTMQIRYQEENPHLSSLVPTENQAAEVTVPNDAAVRKLIELHAHEGIKDDDTYSLLGSAKTSLDRNNCVPYNEVVSQQNTFDGQTNTGSAEEEPLDLSGKNKTIVPNTEADSECNGVNETLNLSKRAGEIAFESLNKQVYQRRREDQHTNIEVDSMKAIRAPIGLYTNYQQSSSLTNARSNEAQHVLHTEKNNECNFTPYVEIENSKSLSTYKLESQVTIVSISPESNYGVTSNNVTPDRINENTVEELPSLWKNQSSIKATESKINRMEPKKSSKANINDKEGSISHNNQSLDGCYPTQNICKDLNPVDTTHEHSLIKTSTNKQACDDNCQSIDQDSETVKKMAFFPKELVDLLGAIPKDQHNKLVDAIAQFIPMTNKETPNPTITVETPKGIIETAEETPSKASPLDSEASKNNNESKLTINIALLPASSILPKKRHSPSARLNTKDNYSSSLSRVSPVTKQSPSSTTTPMLDTNLKKTLSSPADNAIEPGIMNTNANVDVFVASQNTDDHLLKTKPCSTTNSVEKQVQDHSKSKASSESSEKTASLRAVRKTPVVRQSITDEKQPSKPNAVVQKPTVHDFKQTDSEISRSEHENMKSTVDKTESIESHKNIQLYQPVSEISEQIKRESGEDNLENHAATVTSSYVKNKTDSKNILESVTDGNKSNEVNQLELNNPKIPCNKESIFGHNIEISSTIESEIVSPRDVEDDRAETQETESCISILTKNTKKQTKKLKVPRNEIKKSLTSICSIESIATQNETSNEEDTTLAELKIHQAAKKELITQSYKPIVEPIMHNPETDFKNNLNEKTESSMENYNDSVVSHSKPIKVHKAADNDHADHKRSFGKISKDKLHAFINSNDKNKKNKNTIAGENNYLTNIEKAELRGSSIDEVQIKANNESVSQNNTLTKEKLAAKMAKQPKGLKDDTSYSCSNSYNQDDQTFISDSSSEYKQTGKRSLRRSKRGKSMISVGKDFNDLVDTSEANHDNAQTPKTKKQLIFSKLLQDGNLHEDKPEYLVSSLPINDKDVQESNLAIETKTHKSSKRKSSSGKTKTKKNQIAVINQVPSLDNISTVKETDESSYIDNTEIAGSDNVNLMENSIEMQITDSEDIETKKNGCKESIKSDSHAVFKRTKRKSSNSKKSKTKKIKLNIENEKSKQQQESLIKPSKDVLPHIIDVPEPKQANLDANNFNNGSVNNAFNHKECKTRTEKSCEMRTACYNRPIISKKLSSSTSVNAVHTGNYDPYDINMDIDMAESSRPVVKRKSKTVSSSTKTHSKVSSHDQSLDNIYLDSGTEKIALAASNSIPTVISDSDSSISDVPLQKYAEDKEKLRLKAALISGNDLSENDNKRSMSPKQANEAENLFELHSRRDEKMATDNNNKETYESNVGNTEQTDNAGTTTYGDLQQSKVLVEQDQGDAYIDTTETLNTKQTKRKRKRRRTSHNINKPLESEKCIDSCEIYQTKIHRMSNLLASKKITETFHLENKDDITRTKDRRRKSSQCENKKALSDLHPLPATQDIKRNTCKIGSPDREVVTEIVNAPNAITYTVKDDSLVAEKKITEYKEVNPSENIPVMNLETKVQVNIEHSELRAEESHEYNKVEVDNASALDDVADSPATPLSPEMPESPETLQDKPLMYPEEEVNIYEDKYDIIKRRREASANAKQVQKIEKPTKCKKDGNKKQKPEKKNNKKPSKKTSIQSQILTKGALKGFDAIKISITTQDLNLPTTVVPPQPQLHSDIKKQNISGLKRICSYKSDSDAKYADTSDIYEFQDDERPITKAYRLPRPSNEYPSCSSADEYIPVKQFCDEADNFRNVPEAPILYKGKGKGKGKGKRTHTDRNETEKVPLTSYDDTQSYQIKKSKPAIDTNSDTPIYATASEKTLNYQEKAVNSNTEYNKTVTCKNVEAVDVNGDTYDSEMEDRETGRPSGFVPDTNDDSSFDCDPLSPSPLPCVLEGTYACSCLSDISSDDSETERGCAHPSCRYTHLNAAKNAVMGKIFKNNAVRCDKTDDTLDEPPKPKPDLDRLFDSLFEKNAVKPSVEARSSPDVGPSPAHDRSDKCENDRSDKCENDRSDKCENDRSDKCENDRSEKCENDRSDKCENDRSDKCENDRSDKCENDRSDKCERDVSNVDDGFSSPHIREPVIADDFSSPDIREPVKADGFSSPPIREPVKAAKRMFHRDSNALNDTETINDKSSLADDSIYNFAEKTSETIDNKLYIMVSQKHVQTVDPAHLDDHDETKSPSPIPKDADTYPEDIFDNLDKVPESSDYIVLRRKHAHRIKNRGTQTKQQTRKNRRAYKKHKSHHKRTKRSEDGELGRRHGGRSAVKDCRSYVEENDEKTRKQECLHAMDRIASDMRHGEPCRKSDEGISTSHEQSIDACDTGGKGEEEGGLGVTRARRQCALGKQNVLAENWSTSESEDAAPPKGKARKPPNKKSRIPKKDRPGPSRARDSSTSDDSGDDDGGGPSGSGGRVRACHPGASQQELDKRREQELHGWIVGNNYKRLVTMIVYAKSKTATATVTAGDDASPPKRKARKQPKKKSRIPKKDRPGPSRARDFPTSDDSEDDRDR